jgi:hypothetical protein
MKLEPFKFTASIARLEFTHSTNEHGHVTTCIAYAADGNRVHAHAVQGGDEGAGIARNLDYFASLLRGDVLAMRIVEEGAPA